METTLTVKDFFAKESVKKKFEELLQKKSTGFITSVLQAVNSSSLLQKASPESIFNAAVMGAILDLPIQQSLGFAYIVPYKGQAQFQIGYKGLVQLAQRSGKFKTISCSPIYSGQLVKSNPLTGFEFDFNVVPNGKPVGYAAYFSLLNGFEKTIYISVDEIKAHAQRFSQTYSKDFSPWKTDFDAMAQKTVLKMLLSKYAPLSVEMQQAVIADQGVVNDAETLDVTYVDNTPPEPELPSKEDIEDAEMALRVCTDIDMLRETFARLDPKLCSIESVLNLKNEMQNKFTNTKK